MKSLAEIGQAQAVGGVYCKSCPTFFAMTRTDKKLHSSHVPIPIHSLDAIMRHCVKVRLGRQGWFLTISFEPAGAHDVEIYTLQATSGASVTWPRQSLYVCSLCPCTPAAPERLETLQTGQTVQTSQTAQAANYTRVFFYKHN